MDSLESYDLQQEGRRARYLASKMEKAEREAIAIQAALSEHIITSYVRNLPVQDPTYPAIEYLKLSEKVGTSIWDVYRKVMEGQRDFACKDGSHVRFRPNTGKHFMHWAMPGHDRERPKRCGCGFIRNRSGSLVYTACPGHPEHYCKGKRRHCWSMRCPECMNDTAIKRAIKVEKQLLAYKRILEKGGHRVGDIGHFVVSPPQEAMKCAMQTYEDYNAVCKWIEDDLQAIGAKAGVTFFHPWRMQDDAWLRSPHFHILEFGRLDTKLFLETHPGWIIKKIHPKEKIRSIRYTAAYLLTHTGQAYVEKDPDDVDWAEAVVDYMLPGHKKGKSSYSNRDYDQLSQGKGRMVGDISGMDWEQWTMDRLTRDTRLRYWGGVARNKIKVVTIHRQYKVRICKECGHLLRVYEGSEDLEGHYVRYIQDNQILCFAHDFTTVRNFFLKYKEQMKQEDLTPSDVARMMPCAVSTLELFPDNGDLVMDGPFDEPDEKFIRRQESAYGEVSC
ncbi:MAG: hypothetical protein IKP04_03060 [Candidatus Methanomethylophilaceae archaeon]|nr:hypothetical protein [Candidatus Methanomethylophilaceae archaeon]